MPDDLASRVPSAAAERGVAPEEVAREALAERFPAPPALSIIGLGASGHAGTVAERHKAIRGGHFPDKTASDA